MPILFDGYRTRTGGTSSPNKMLKCADLPSDRKAFNDSATDLRSLTVSILNEGEYCK